MSRVLPSLKLSASFLPLKIDGFSRRSFPFWGPPSFPVRAVSFREGILPKFNMEPKSDGFQKESPTPGCHFQVNHVKLWEGQTKAFC